MKEQLIQWMSSHANAENAKWMKKYMKNHFEFLGIKTPERRKLATTFFAQSGIFRGSLDEDLVRFLWDQSEREFQYLAVDYLIRMKGKLTTKHLPLIEYLITHKSWWDTIDPIASVVVGHLVANSPEVITVAIEPWSSRENIWLRRTTLLFQLRYKQRTNEALLYRFIEKNAACTEFFIQKAIGWSLREYAKTNPESVRNFIATHHLAKLSVREASKHIGLFSLTALTASDKI